MPRTMTPTQDERQARRMEADREELAERIYQLSMSGNLDEANRLDREFHDRLMHISGNGLMVGLVRQYRWAIKVVWSYNDPAETRRTHLEVLKAIEENRPDDAERVMREQVRVSRDITERRLAEAPSELHWIPRGTPTSSFSQEGL